MAGIHLEKSDGQLSDSTDTKASSSRQKDTENVTAHILSSSLPQQLESSATPSLSSVEFRYPVITNNSPSAKILSRIPEMVDPHLLSQSDTRYDLSTPSPERQSHVRPWANGLWSPTSTYSQEAEPSLTPRREPSYTSANKLSPVHGPKTSIDDAESLRDTALTVLNDPRAQDLAFMQRTRSGWTADLDQFVYSKHELEQSSAQVATPKCGGSPGHAKQDRAANDRSSVEQDLAAIGYSQVHAAIERQQQDNKYTAEKSLQAPSDECFASEPHVSLESTGMNIARTLHYRSQTAPTVPQFRPEPSHEPQPSMRHLSPLAQWAFGDRRPLYSTTFENSSHFSARSARRNSPHSSFSHPHISQTPDYQTRPSYSSNSSDQFPLMNFDPHGLQDSTHFRQGPEEAAFREYDGATTSLDRTARYDQIRARDNHTRNLDLAGLGHDLVQHTEDIMPDRSTTVSALASESLPRASVDKLWGEKGLLSRPGVSSWQSKSQKGKRIPLKEMASRLFKSKEPPQLPSARSSISAEARPTDSNGSSRFPISIERGHQMRLFGEVEYMIQTLANDFLLEQLDNDRLSKRSVKEVVDKWSHKGRAQVVDFCFDLRTQLELLQRNIDNVQFRGKHAFDSQRKFVLVYAWKDVARELSVRSFCSADSAIRKMLSDCYVIFEMLGAEGPYWLIFQKLHVTTLDKIEAAEEERKKRAGIVFGQTRQVVPGSPCRSEYGEDEIRTNRHLFETL